MDKEGTFLYLVYYLVRNDGIITLFNTCSVLLPYFMSKTDACPNGRLQEANFRPQISIANILSTGLLQAIFLAQK